MLEKHKLIKIFLSIIWLKFYLAKYRTENNFGILCLLIRCIKIDDNDNGSRLAWYEREFSSTTKRRIILRPENNWARRGVATPTQQAHETGGIRQGFFAPILMMKIYSITLIWYFCWTLTSTLTMSAKLESVIWDTTRRRIVSEFFLI